MDDVAARAGVSRSLVSLVMRESERVSESSRLKVLDAAEALGYRPNLMARNLARNRTNIIGLLLDDLHNPFYADAADGAGKAAADHGYRIIMSAGFRDGETERRAIETFLEFRTDGLVLVSPRCGIEPIVAAAAIAPVVTIGDRVVGTGVGCIVNDDRVGAALAVDHLVGLGHRDIVHIDGGARSGAADRRDGYVVAMQTNGIGDRVRILAGEFTEAAGVAGAEALVQSDAMPTAVFAANDLVAAGLIGRLRELGVSVPNDLSVVGYDNTALSELHHLSLTTINQPREEMGRLAMEVIVDHLERGREVDQHVLAPDLVVRSTTAAPRRAD